MARKRKVAPKKRAEDCDDVETFFDAGPGHAATLEARDEIAEALMDAIRSVVEINVLMREADAETFNKNTPRLKSLIDLVNALPRTPPPARSIGFTSPKQAK